MEFTVRKAKKEDAQAALALINELAIYEKEPDAVEVDLEQFIKDGFGEETAFQLLVAEARGEVHGIALYYQKYSTWKGRSLYLEDLIVTSDSRGKGIGMALFKAVINEANRMSAGRMDWQVLDWNRSAIDFYASLGAKLDDEWINGSFSKEQIKEICKNEGI